MAEAREQLLEGIGGMEYGALDIEDHPYFSASLDRLESRLLPLRHLEAALIARLVPPEDDEDDNVFAFSIYPQQDKNKREQQQQQDRDKEVFVRPTMSWKNILIKGKGVDRGPGGMMSCMSASSSMMEMELDDEAANVLHYCRHDIVSLWHNPTVQEVLRKRKVRLEEQPGLYVA